MKHGIFYIAQELGTLRIRIISQRPQDTIPRVDFSRMASEFDLIGTQP